MHRGPFPLAFLLPKELNPYVFGGDLLEFLNSFRRLSTSRFMSSNRDSKLSSGDMYWTRNGMFSGVRRCRLARIRSIGGDRSRDRRQVSSCILSLRLTAERGDSRRVCLSVSCPP